jgi:Rieske Fe-S protein
MRNPSEHPPIRLPTIDGEGPSLDRRGFLTRSAALAVLATLAGSCAVQDPLSPQLTTDLTVDLADYPELSTVDGVARLRGTDVPIALVNAGDGNYLALSLICPHQGGSINWNGNDFVCSQHGATFAEDGHWVGGQSTGPMYEYHTSYDALNGTVTVSP